MSKNEFVPSREDVILVASTVGISDLSVAEIDSVISGYPEAQKNDGGATWDLVVENLVHKTVSDRKK